MIPINIDEISSTSDLQHREIIMRKNAFEIPLSLIASSILLAMGQAAFAASENAEQVLDTLVVKAEPLDEDETTTETGSSVSVISQDQIEKTLTQNLDDLLRYEPGVDATQDSRFGISGVTIRGLDKERVKITVDGVEQAQAYGPTSTYLRTGRNTVDLESLESVEIEKGGDIVEGSGAFGGTVKYRTKEPSSFLKEEGDDTYVSLKAGYQSASNEFSETMTAANRTGKVDSLIVYTHRNGNETENYYGDAGSDTTTGSSDRTSVDPEDNGSDNVLAKVQYQVNDTNRVGFVGEYFDSTSDSDLYSESSSSSMRYADDSRRRKHIGIFHENTQSNTLYDRLKWQLDYQDTKTINRTTIESSDSTRVVDRFYDEESTEFKGDLVKNMNDHQLRYGINYSHKSLENLNKDTSGSTSRFSPLADADIFGAYLEDSWAVTDRLTLIPAIRYDSYQYSTTGDEYVDAYDDSNNDAFTAQLSAEFELTPTYSLFGKYGTGFRAPSLDELYYYYDAGRGYAILPNPDLESETSVFLETGIRAKGDYGSAELVAFYNDYKNFIETTYNTGSTSANPYGEYTSVNLDRVIIKGVELKGDLDLSKALGISKGWALQGAVAYAEGDNLEDDEPLDSIAPLSFVTGIGYDAPSKMWGSKVNLTWVSSKDESDLSSSSQSLAIPSHKLLDVTAYYKPTDAITINAGLFNAFDEKYWVWNDIRDLSGSTNLERYTRAGRNFGVDITVAF